MRNFWEMVRDRWEGDRSVCVGLDSDINQIPKFLFRDFMDVEDPVFRFNVGIIKATAGIVCAFKPNIAFYEACGEEGISALRRTIEYIHRNTDVPVILDAKRADIGNTNAGYVRFIFEYLGADAVTVHPYLGREALQPFLERKDKGVFVLCRTSNPGAGEFQDLRVEGEPLYCHVARHIASEWNGNENCGLVVGATYLEELRKVREIVGDMPILIPGIGAQGGDLERTVLAGKNSQGQGMIINSSRGIIFASKGKDFAEAAEREALRLHREIISILR
jgi:orotidine-5'-phosphate decarboxylase